MPVSFSLKSIDDYYSFGFEGDGVLARFGRISICQLSGSRQGRAYRSSDVHYYSPFTGRDDASWCGFEMELLGGLLRSIRGAERHTTSVKSDLFEP